MTFDASVHGKVLNQAFCIHQLFQFAMALCTLNILNDMPFVTKDNIIRQRGVNAIPLNLDLISEAFMQLPLFFFFLEIFI